MTVDLRFLGAEKVAGPAGSLAGLELCSRDHERVGTIDGVLIDPLARRVRYFVLRLADQPIHWLLGAETPLRIEAEPRLGWIESSRADLDLEPYEPDEAPPFTAEDAVTAMFARPAA
jgi:hypothetical protein